MFKAIIATAFIASFAVAPAFAATECTDASMKKMMMEGDKMPAGAAKTAAMKEGKMADDMMKKGDKKACAMHMDNAMKEMKK